MTTKELLARIERHIAATGAKESNIGREAVNDSCLVLDIRRGRELGTELILTISDYLDAVERGEDFSATNRSSGPRPFTAEEDRLILLMRSRGVAWVDMVPSFEGRHQHTLRKRHIRLTAAPSPSRSRDNADAVDIRRTDAIEAATITHSSDALSRACQRLFEATARREGIPVNIAMGNALYGRDVMARAMGAAR